MPGMSERVLLRRQLELAMRPRAANHTSMRLLFAFIALLRPAAPLSLAGSPTLAARARWPSPPDGDLQFGDLEKLMFEGGIKRLNQGLKVRLSLRWTPNPYEQLQR